MIPLLKPRSVISKPVSQIHLLDFETVLQNHLASKAVVLCARYYTVNDMSVEHLVITGSAREGAVSIIPFVEKDNGKLLYSIVCKRLDLLKIFGMDLRINPRDKMSARLDVNADGILYRYAIKMVRHRYHKGPYPWTFQVNPAK